MSCPDLQRYIPTHHALWEMQRRHISEADVALVLAAPEQREEVRPGVFINPNFPLASHPNATY